MFIMDKHDFVLSVGCVICASTFTKSDQHFVITTCGHLYHTTCLSKWFASALELDGRKTCPDCRTFLGNSIELTQPAYLSFPIPDDLKTEFSELERDITEKEKRINKLLLDNRKLKDKLNAELAKSKRSATQRAALAKKHQKTVELLRTAMAPEKKDNNEQKIAEKSMTITKKLRNRDVVYKRLA